MNVHLTAPLFFQELAALESADLLSYVREHPSRVIEAFAGLSRDSARPHVGLLKRVFIYLPEQEESEMGKVITAIEWLDLFSVATPDAILSVLDSSQPQKALTLLKRNDIASHPIVWIPILFNAARGNHLEVVSYLLDNGINNIEIVNPDDGLTLLQYACKKKNEALARLALLHSADIHSISDRFSNWTPLHFACSGDLNKAERAIIGLLLENGANLGAQDSEGNTPLHVLVDSLEQCCEDMYCEDNHMELLRKFSESVNYTNFIGQTPLHVAVSGNSFVMASILLELGSDCSAATIFKQNPLHCLCETDQAEEDNFKTFLQYVPAVDFQDIEGDGYLHLLARSLTPDRLPILYCVLHKGFDPNLVNEEGETPFYVLCKRIQESQDPSLEDAIFEFVSYGAKVDLPRRNGLLPLDFVSSSVFSTLYRKRVIVSSGYLPAIIFEGAIVSKDVPLLGMVFPEVNWRVFFRRLERKELEGIPITNPNYLEKALLTATALNCQSLVKYLLKKNVGVNSTNNGEFTGCTSLHIAARCGYVDLARILVQNAANINYRNRNDDTPLHFALMWGQEEFVSFLIECGAFEYLNGNSGNTCLHYAALSGKIRLARRFIGQVYEITETGKTALSLSVSIGDYEMSQYLIENGADVKAEDAFNRTILLELCFGKNFSTRLLDLLLENGADISTEVFYSDVPVIYSDSEGVEQSFTNHGSYLHCLFHQRRMGLMKAFLDRGIDVDIADGNGKTILHLLLEGYNKIRMEYGDEGILRVYEAIIRRILSKNPNLELLDNQGLCSQDSLQEDVFLSLQYTGVFSEVKHISKKYFTTQILKHVLRLNPESLVLKRLVPEVNWPQFLSPYSHDSLPTIETILFSAVRSNLPNLVEFLLEMRLGPNLIDVNTEKTPFIVLVAECCDHSMMDIVLKYPVDLESSNIYGATALHIACARGMNEAVHSLIKKGANPKAIDKEGFGCVHYACKSNSIATVGLFLADIEMKSLTGCTPLHTAVSHNLVAVANYLLENGAKVDDGDVQRTTPFLLSCAKPNSEEMIDVLIDFGADINAQNESGENGLNIVLFKAPNNERFENLLKRGVSPNLQDPLGNTILSYVGDTEKGTLESCVWYIHLLLSYGADLDIVNIDGKRPADFWKRDVVRHFVLNGTLHLKGYIPEAFLKSAIEERDIPVLSAISPKWNWEAYFRYYAGGANEPSNLVAFVNSQDSFLLNPVHSIEDLFIPSLFIQSTTLYDSTKQEAARISSEDTHDVLRSLRNQYPRHFYRMGNVRLLSKIPMPETPKLDIPQIPDSFTLDSAMIIFNFLFNSINFTDPANPFYIPPNKIFDQEMPSTQLRLKTAMQMFCMVSKDPSKSLYKQETENQKGYQALNRRFIEAMYGLNLYNKKFSDKKIDLVERAKIKQTIDTQVMLIAASGNHCLLAKNDAVVETRCVLFGGTLVRSISNQANSILRDRRLVLVEDLFKFADLLDSHRMYTFISHEGETLGLSPEDLISDDPFIVYKPETYNEPRADFFKNYNKSLVLHTTGENLKKDGNISHELFLNWLIENVPDEWSFYGELAEDIRFMLDPVAKKHLWERHALAVTPEIAIEIRYAPEPGAVKAHLAKLSEIEEEVRLAHSTVEKQSEVSRLEALESELEKKETQLFEDKLAQLNEILSKYPHNVSRIENTPKDKLHELSSEIPAFLIEGVALRSALLCREPAAKELEEVVNERTSVQRKLMQLQMEISRQKMREKRAIDEAVSSYTREIDAVPDSIRAIDFVLHLKATADHSCIRKQLVLKGVEEQWQVLDQYDIERSENPSVTPVQALKESFGRKYATSSEKNGRVREDRVYLLLESLAHLTVY